MDRITIGSEVSYRNYRFYVAAFLKDDKTLSSKPTNWVLITRTSDKSFNQITVHISLLQFEN